MIKLLNACGFGSLLRLGVILVIGAIFKLSLGLQLLIRLMLNLLLVVANVEIFVHFLGIIVLDLVLEMV